MLADPRTEPAGVLALHRERVSLFGRRATSVHGSAVPYRRFVPNRRHLVASFGARLGARNAESVRGARIGPDVVALLDESAPVQ
jgi:hypothetical protein